MKRFVVIVLLMFFFIINVFGQKCVIYGTTANHLSYKYAYLYDSDSKTFVTTPIIKNKFIFNLDKPGKLKVLILSFNT